MVTAIQASRLQFGSLTPRKNWASIVANCNLSTQKAGNPWDKAVSYPTASRNKMEHDQGRHVKLASWLTFTCVHPHRCKNIHHTVKQSMKAIFETWGVKEFILKDTKRGCPFISATQLGDLEEEGSYFSLSEYRPRNFRCWKHSLCSSRYYTAH